MLHLSLELGGKLLHVLSGVCHAGLVLPAVAQILVEALQESVEDVVGRGLLAGVPRAEDPADRLGNSINVEGRHEGLFQRRDGRFHAVVILVNVHEDGVVGAEPRNTLCRSFGGWDWLAGLPRPRKVGLVVVTVVIVVGVSGSRVRPQQFDGFVLRHHLGQDAVPSFAPLPRNDLRDAQWSSGAPVRVEEAAVGRMETSVDRSFDINAVTQPGIVNFIGTASHGGSALFESPTPLAPPGRNRAVLYVIYQSCNDVEAAVAWRPDHLLKPTVPRWHHPDVAAQQARQGCSLHAQTQTCSCKSCSVPARGNTNMQLQVLQSPWTIHTNIQLRFLQSLCTQTTQICSYKSCSLHEQYTQICSYKSCSLPARGNTNMHLQVSMNDAHKHVATSLAVSMNDTYSAS